MIFFFKANCPDESKSVRTPFWLLLILSAKIFAPIQGALFLAMSGRHFWRPPLWLDAIFIEAAIAPLSRHAKNRVPTGDVLEIFFAKKLNSLLFNDILFQSKLSG